MNERKSFQEGRYNASDSNTNIVKNKKRKFCFHYSDNKLQSSKQTGITLIALVISIIVMLILAGVSLNATIGDNGIITQAQNATYMQSITALEEYLQTEYVKYYDETENYTNKIELLSSKLGNLCLKDGTKNYITYDGKMYYLINKQALPDDVKNQLKGGDTTEYLKYIRLQDVYGVTPDLKVYYCESGTDNALGTLDSTELDPSTPLKKINQDVEMKSAITEALESIGVTVGENGVTVGDASKIKNLELDGSKHNITSISGLSELSSLKTVTLSNLNLNDLEGLQNCTLLYYVYFKNCKINDYSKLATVLDLQYLYLYLPPSMSEADANAQVNNLGNGLANATELNKVEYFGISGTIDLFELNYNYSLGYDYDKYTFYKSSSSNLSDISGLNNISANIKNNIKYIYLNNNKFSSIEPLKDFTNIYELDIMGNANLTNLDGLENHNIVYLTAQYCKLSNISGLMGNSKLKYLALEKNVNLQSLNGLEEDLELNTLLAYKCDLINITALQNHLNLKYLSIYDNLNLESIIALKNCTGINNLYLANNEKMIGTEVRDALADQNTHILENCGKNCTIPNKYMMYFANLTSYDYSYKNYGKKLTDDSDEINALKNKKVNRLNLSGQDLISDSKLQEILSTLPEMVALNLSDCSNLTTINFIKNAQMSKLQEIDIRGTDKRITDLSDIINTCKDLRTLIINNTDTDLSKIQTLFEKGGKGCVLSWNDSAENYCTGLILAGNLSQYKFDKCDSFKKFYARNIRVKDYEFEGILDLSKCTMLTEINNTNYCSNMKLPSSINSISTNSWNSYLDLSLCENLKAVEVSSYNNYALNLFDTLNKNARLTYIVFYQKDLNDNNSGIKNINFSQIETLGIGSLDSTECNIKDFSFLNSADNLKVLRMRNCVSCTNFSFIENKTNLTEMLIENNKNMFNLDLSKCISLNKIQINNSNLNSIKLSTQIKYVDLNQNKISDLKFLTNLNDLKEINLQENNITNLEPLESLILNGKSNCTIINLSNNIIQTTTLNGHNNINTLKKLYDAGLRTLDISGNNFTAGSTDELRKLNWTSYKE